MIGGSYLIYLSKKNNPIPPMNTGYASSIPTTTDITDSKFPGIKISTEISNDPTIPVAVQYPQSTDEDFNLSIQKHIKQVKDNHLKQLNSNKHPSQVVSGELNISFKTYTHHSGLYSFVLNNYSDISGYSNTTEVHTFHFNPDTKKEISIQDIFENDVDRLAAFSSIVRQQLEADDKLKDSLISEQVERHTQPTWSNFQKFAVTDEALLIHFDQNVIASHTAGTPTVTIPLTKINTLIAPDFQIKEEEKEQKKENKPKRVALTFDDGPDPKVTTQILDLLDKYDAKATFFMLGSRVEYYPEIAKSVQKAGHELGNHTWNHPNLVKANTKKIQEEILNTSAIIEEVTGEKATAFRPPYGSFNDIVNEQSGLPLVLWDVDTLDWKHRNPHQLLNYVKQGTQDGSIILMHDIHQSTADGLDAVLSYLKGEGYTFVTVSDLE